MTDWIFREFIDQENLSMIAARVRDDREIEVVLRDCSRQIHWIVPCTPDGVAKVECVIGLLGRIRKTAILGAVGGRDGNW